MNTPLAVAESLDSGPGRVLLHSGCNADGLGRYSFCADRPVCVLVAHGPRVTEYRRGVRTLRDEAPLDCLERLCREFDPNSGAPDHPEAFAMGYLGYGLADGLRSRAGRPAPGCGEPDLWFAFYDAVVRWDHESGACSVVGRNRQAMARLRERVEARAPASVSARVGPFQSSKKSDARYRHGVARALEYIESGDVYQVNVARRLTASVDGTEDSVALYRRLSSEHPVPYGAVIDTDRGAILSASPERFLYRRGRSCRLETRPIKGTRPRGRETDGALLRELADDPKERAEHLMIVDLERNDLGRIAIPGTVSVDSFAHTVTLSTVHHVVSTVSCEPRADVGLAAILRATFPGGSITGAPKRRAMEIIDELEPVSRGVYTGAIGYFGSGGALDLSIAIRTAVLRGKELELLVGGGVVADSTVEGEYEETLHKAAAWATLVGDRESGTLGESGARYAMAR